MDHREVDIDVIEKVKALGEVDLEVHSRRQAEGPFGYSEPRVQDCLGGLDPADHGAVVVMAGGVRVRILDKAANRDPRRVRTWFQVNRP